MARAVRAGVAITVDERSIRSFSKNVDALVRATGEMSRAEIMDFCEDVLYDANNMIPIDTGTAAESAGYKVTKESYGYSARMGYAIFKNPINPRTGKPASSYIATIHEAYHSSGQSNGQGKFFEKALFMNTEDFYRRTRESLQSILAAPELRSIPKSFSSSEARHRYMAYQSRLNSGFTARHGGKILPYPPYGEEVPTGRKTTKKTAQSVREKQRNKFSRKKQLELGAAHPKRSNRGSYSVEKKTRKEARAATKRTKTVMQKSNEVSSKKRKKNVPAKSSKATTHKLTMQQHKRKYKQKVKPNASRFDSAIEHITGVLDYAIQQKANEEKEEKERKKRQ